VGTVPDGVDLLLDHPLRHLRIGHIQLRLDELHWIIHVLQSQQAWMSESRTVQGFGMENFN
jgi:hypothetical protein